MEKYGVDEDATPKTASNDELKCPQCGKRLRNKSETGVLVCPQCGSQPFESTEPASNKK